MKRPRAPAQQVLPFGPRRRPKHWAKPGPKPRPERDGFLHHRRRPAHDSRHPVLVTMRCVSRVPSLRSELVLAAIARQIAANRGGARAKVGVVHYSIQENHLHLIAEATDKERLARGMQRLFSRIAFEVNRVLRRTGRLFRDRHHREALTSPTHMRRALVYVLFNRRKHLVQKGRSKGDVVHVLDLASSIGWFEGWSKEHRPPEEVLEQIRAGPCKRGAPSTTWLGSVGWIRGGGYLRDDEMPVAKERLPIQRSPRGQTNASR
jgi:putative transposase